MNYTYLLLLVLTLSACTSHTGNNGKNSYVVFGKRYYVMQSASGYQKKGLASWYGKAFHGKKTSSGIVYDMHKLTAAHKSLPLNTWVEVRNIENNKRIVVLVNDRGPFHGNRIIDLSYEAARQLGMVDQGTAKVEVVALARKSPPLRGQADLYIQLGSFSRIENAQDLLGKAKRLGYNTMIDSATVSSKQLYRVRIGPMDSSTYQKILPALRRDGFTNTAKMFDVNE